MASFTSHTGERGEKTGRRQRPYPGQPIQTTTVQRTAMLTWDIESARPVTETGKAKDGKCYQVITVRYVLKWSADVRSEYITKTDVNDIAIAAQYALKKAASVPLFGFGFGILDDILDDPKPEIRTWSQNTKHKGSESYWSALVTEVECDEETASNEIGAVPKNKPDRDALLEAIKRILSTLTTP